MGSRASAAMYILHSTYVSNYRHSLEERERERHRHMYVYTCSVREFGISETIKKKPPLVAPTSRFPEIEAEVRVNLNYKLCRFIPGTIFGSSLVTFSAPLFFRVYSYIHMYVCITHDRRDKCASVYL